MRVLVLNCDFDRDMRTNGGEAIKRSLIGMGVHDVVVKRAFAGRLPSLKEAESFNAVIISGSEAGVYEKRAWIGRLARFVKEMDSVGIPTLGICFGAEIIAHALGGEVVPSGTYRKGYCGVRVTGMGARAPLFAGIKRRLAVYENHGDTIRRLPRNSTMLATSKDGVEAYAVRGLLGVQFHPEVLPVTARLIAASDGGDARAELNTTPNNYRLPLKVISNFIDSVK